MSSSRRTSERPVLDVPARGRLGADRRAAARARRDDRVRGAWGWYALGGSALVGYIVLRLATG